jgi:eukaryotic-like serine/threonine-protein kinase
MPSDPNERLPLEQFRSYLLCLARERLCGRAGPDPSDIVQQTLLEAHQGIQCFRGTTAAEQAVWLRQILAHNLADANRARYRERRDIRRERSLEAELEASSARLADWLADEALRRACGPSGMRKPFAWPTPWPSCRKRNGRLSCFSTGTASAWPRLGNASAAVRSPWLGCSSAGSSACASCSMIPADHPVDFFPARPIPPRTTPGRGGTAFLPSKGPTMSEREERLDAAIAAYYQALESGQPVDRAAFLAGYPDLADELTSFLNDKAAFERRAGATVPAPAEAPTLAPAAPQGSPAGPSGPETVRYFGDYELLAEIARGGMGVVYRARQVSLNRPVALKMILAGQLASATDVQRFHAEAEAAGNLDHPHIGPIYEVGTHEGQHYFSMKLVAGSSLASVGRAWAGTRQGRRRIAELVATIAHAVHHAHQRGVLHRDLKPSNILLDAEDRPHVTDFGLAKRVTSDSRLTQSNSIAGTPAYMAPEQAAGKKGLTVAVDVYGLGAVLYELLTGRPPFQAETPFDTLRQVLEDEPARPRDVNPAIEPDLETICLKCLRKEPERRYGSTQDLALDLQRFLDDEPILARSAGAVERVARWCRRNPALAGAGMTVLLLLVAVAVGATWSAVTIRAETQEVELQRSIADARATAEKAAHDDAEEQRRLAERHEAEARRALYAAHINLAQQAWEGDNVRRALALLTPYIPGPGEAEGRTFEWHHLWHLCHADRHTLQGHAGPVLGVAFLPGGQTLASAGADGTVRLWDAAAGKEVARLEGMPGPVRALAASPDGRTLATAAGDGVLQLWDVATRRPRATLPRRPAETLAFAPDGRTLAVGGRDDVLLWDVAGAKPRATLKAPELMVSAISFSSNSRILAAGGEWEGAARAVVWDLSTGKEAVRLKRTEEHGATRLPPQFLGIGRISSVALSPDGKRLATGHTFSYDNGNGEAVVKLWDLATGTLSATLAGHREGITAVAFAEGGRAVAAADAEGTVRLWDLATLRERGVYRGHRDVVLCLAYSPGGATLATGAADNTVKLWDAVPERERDTLHPEQQGILTLALTADGATLATGGSNGTTRLWDVRTGTPLPPLQGQPCGGPIVAVEPDGRTLATGGTDGRVQLWDLATRRPRRTLTGHARQVTCLAFAPGGRLLASGSQDQSVVLWDPSDGRQVAVLRGHPNEISALAFAPDGRTLTVASGEPLYQFNKAHDLRLWDVGAGQVRGTLPLPGGAVTGLAFSPDGKQLAGSFADASSTTAPGGAVLWDVAALKKVRTFTGHKNFVWAVAFSPDGRTLATAGHDGVVKLWDPAGGEERAALKGHTGPVHALAFARDNSLLVTASGAPVELINRGGEVLLWRAGPGGRHAE